MRTVFLLGIAVAGLAGCASGAAGSARGERDFSGVIQRTVPSVHVGEAHVLDARPNPMAPMDVSSEGGAIAVRFTGRGGARLTVRLDESSLQTLAVSQPDDGRTSAPSTEAARVVLDGRRFIVFWTRGSTELGRRALAQEFNADGSARGAPVVISPPDADVMGVPRAVKTSDGRVVATFIASSSDSFQLMAVPVEDAFSPPVSELTAQR
jgi:hypothetical protein